MFLCCCLIIRPGIRQCGKQENEEPEIRQLFLGIFLHIMDKHVASISKGRFMELESQALLLGVWSTGQGHRQDWCLLDMRSLRIHLRPADPGSAF